MISKGITDKEKVYMNDKFLAFIENVYKLQDSNGYEFNYAFHALPLRSNLEYYKVIKNPMSYSKVKMSAKHKRYTHPQAFINDLAQITWNARFFNEESSEYYKFALILDDYIKKTIIPTLQNDNKIYQFDKITYPNLGPLPNNNDLYNGSSINQNQLIHESQPTIQTQPPQSTQSTQLTQSTQSTQSTQPQNQIQSLPESSIKPPPISQPQTTQLGTNTLNNNNITSANNNTTNSNNNNNTNNNLNDNLTPLPDDDDEEDYKDDETKNEEIDELDYRSISNQQYNPNSYTAKIEDTGKQHIYTPPQNINNHIPNRQILEQWVKRGRPPIVDKPHEQRIKSIMRGLKKIKVGTKTIVSFWDKLPSQQDHPDYLRVVKDPITMLDIKSLIKQRYYKTVDSYVADVFKLINNNRNYFIHDEFIKNNLNILETNISRLYQIEMSKPDVEFMSGHQTSKFPLSQVIFNNKTYKVGNWVLVRNPNDPLRPTVAQIFRLWQQDDGELCMNVCWYYRPEWTVHRVDRLFLENEVVKTGQYRDHLVSEIVGPCYVAYFTRWLKGDPGIQFEGPLFVCEFRYNDRENTFAKIRTWKACLPDEVRHLEDPIKPLTYNRVLKKFPSPIKHLLLPGSTSTSPMPQPIILNLNSPPLVGAVYIPRDNDEKDLHYFDNSLNSTECKSYVPPTTNIRIPSSALIENYSNDNNNNNESMNDNRSDKLPGTNTLNIQQTNLNLLNLRSNNITPNYATNIPLTTTISNNTGNININNMNIMTNKKITSNAITPTTTSTYNNNANNNYGVSSFKAYSKPPTMNINSSMNMANNVYPGSNKIIKSPYNLSTYSFSQYHSPSSSFTFIKENDNEDLSHELIKTSYLKLDKFNYGRLNKQIKQQQNNLGSYSEDDNLNKIVETNSLIWFRGPPLKINDRILNDEVYDNIDNCVGIKRVKLGHSAEYLSWKLKKQKKIIK